VWVDASGITIAWSDGPVERWVSSGAIPFAGLWRMARSMRLR
jgi:hypothetical protein